MTWHGGKQALLDGRTRDLFDDELMAGEASSENPSPFTTRPPSPWTCSAVAPCTSLPVTLHHTFHATLPLPFTTRHMSLQPSCAARSTNCNNTATTTRHAQYVWGAVGEGPSEGVRCRLLSLSPSLSRSLALALSRSRRHQAHKFSRSRRHHLSSFAARNTALFQDSDSDSDSDSELAAANFLPFLQIICHRTTKPTS